MYQSLVFDYLLFFCYNKKSDYARVHIPFILIKSRIKDDIVPQEDSWKPRNRHGRPSVLHMVEFDSFSTSEIKPPLILGAQGVMYDATYYDKFSLDRIPLETPVVR